MSNQIHPQSSKYVSLDFNHKKFANLTNEITKFTLKFAKNQKGMDDVEP
jgi:hypothetical protein